jgi:hypothetical protein
MPNPESPSNPDSLHHEKARLRKIGLLILIAGVCAAGLVYWIGNRPEDPALADYRQSEARAETRQMESLYGTSGDVIQKVMTGMRRPRNQAIAVIAITVAVSGVCFYLGRPFHEGEETN